MQIKTVVIQVTTRCPLNCPQCYMHRYGENMSFKTACFSVDEAKNLGAKMIQFTGGEPLCYTDLCQAVKHAAKQGLLTAVSTSGCGLDAEAAKSLQKNGLTALCVSLNGSCKEVNDYSRCGFEYALQAIKHAKSVGLLTFINFVARQDNIFDLKNLIELAKNNGVFAVNILKNSKNSFGELASALDNQGFAVLHELKARHGDFINIENCFFNKQCDAMKSMYFVNVDGTYSPCSRCDTVKKDNLLKIKLLQRYC